MGSLCCGETKGTQAITCWSLVDACWVTTVCEVRICSTLTAPLPGVREVLMFHQKLEVFSKLTTFRTSSYRTCGYQNARLITKVQMSLHELPGPMPVGAFTDRFIRNDVTCSATWWDCRKPRTSCFDTAIFARRFSRYYSCVPEMHRHWFRAISHRQNSSFPARESVICISVITSFHMM